MISRLRSLVFGWIGLSAACGGLLLCLGCGDTVVNVPPSPVPTPTPTPTPEIARNQIEFRVNGNPSSVRVRYSTPADGLAQVLTSLPFQNGFSTTATSVFLTLEATPIQYQGIMVFPFLSVQIVVNDTVFREATSADFSLQTLSVSGTWRR